MRQKVRWIQSIHKLLPFSFRSRGSQQQHIHQPAAQTLTFCNRPVHDDQTKLYKVEPKNTYLEEEMHSYNYQVNHQTKLKAGRRYKNRRD